MSCVRHEEDIFHALIKDVRNVEAFSSENETLAVVHDDIWELPSGFKGKLCQVLKVSQSHPPEKVVKKVHWKHPLPSS